MSHGAADHFGVAPLVGAWIEMCDFETTVYKGQVAPLVGAWIEIMLEMWLNQTKKSLPSWERGLKLAVATVTQ